MTHPTDLLYPHAVGETEADVRSSVERHLADCAECAADVAALREVHARLSRLPLEKPDSSFNGRLRARIAAAPGSPARPWAWAAAGAAAAAAVILSALLLWPPRAPALPTTPEAPAGAAATAGPLFLVAFQEDIRWRDALDSGSRRARSVAFSDWFVSLSRQGRIVSGGKRLRDEGGRVVLTGGATVAPDAREETLTGFILLRAADYDEAVALVRECPVVTMGRGRVIVKQVS